jgi:hypothetical protein
MRISTVMTRAAVVAVLTTLAWAVPHNAGPVHGQEFSQPICGAQSIVPPIRIGQPNADGWVGDKEALADGSEVRRYRFTVKDRGVAYVYVGDQWYDLNLGLFSVKTNSDVGCWDVKARGASTESERRKLQFVRPDERALDVESGDYILTVRGGDGVAVDPSRPFTVRVAVGPRVCALQPANIPDATYQDLANKPDNPDVFQVGVSIQPDGEPGQFTLMSFNAYVSPPYTDLFDFTWELDGQVVPNEAGPTVLKPYAELPKMTMGLHTVKLTAKGAREYQDPTESRYNFTPFNGESKSVTCQFRGAP